MRTLLSTTMMCALAISASATGATKLAFVTSATGNGDLNSWPEANGQMGLAAGDQICRTLATNANLPDPQTFVAWLSDSNNDAYCRVFGDPNITGKKSANCGQMQLPTNAGPWMRVDGEPFADVLAEATTNVRLFSALNVDESGTKIADSQQEEYTFTATSSLGTLPTGTTACNNWQTADTTTATVGSMYQTGTSWADRGALRCDRSFRLYCLQTGTGDPLPNKQQWGQRGAFLTIATGRGNLATWPSVPMGVTGVDAGDAVCRKEATDRGFYQANSYKAWLSDGTTNALGRFTNDGPWIRQDGLRFADGKTHLTNGTLLHRPLNVDAAGNFLRPAGVYAWTGTVNGNTDPGNRHCMNWSSANGSNLGMLGTINTIQNASLPGFGSWSADVVFGCSGFFDHLYCLSDADVIFWNGMEEPSL